MNYSIYQIFMKLNLYTSIFMKFDSFLQRNFVAKIDHWLKFCNKATHSINLVFNLDLFNVAYIIPIY